MCSPNSVSSCIIRSFWKRAIAQGNLCIISNGAPKTFISMMLISARQKRSSSSMTSWFPSFAELSWLTKVKFSALVVDTKITYAATGCLSTIIINRSSLIEVLFFSEDLISQPCIPKEALFSSSVETTPKVSTQHVKNLIFKMTHGAELRIWMSPETQQHPAFSIISTSMYFPVGPNSIKKKSPTQLKCTISTITCGEW